MSEIQPFLVKGEGRDTVFQKSALEWWKNSGICCEQRCELMKWSRRKQSYYLLSHMEGISGSQLKGAV